MPSSRSPTKLRHRPSTKLPSPLTSSSNRTPNHTSLLPPILLSTASSWPLILTLIFGGCCSNAYTLELATTQLPQSGTLITFAQFFVTTLSTLPYFLVFTPSFPYIHLKPRVVPLWRWAVQVAFYLTTSLLNNWAFGYDVPMSVHIVFRSGGLVVNMILGWLVQKRRYTKMQVAGVMLVTAGVVSSTLYSTGGSGAEGGGEGYATGVLLLFSALVLTGFMGLWQEQTFRLYGNQNWRESLFYSHLLSLPIFLLRPQRLMEDVRAANATPQWWIGLTPPSLSPSHILHKVFRNSTRERIFFLNYKGEGVGLWIPSFYPPLLLNVATQLLCINGVNRLTSKVSSLSVTLVLVVRKALSLLISVMIVQGGKGSLELWLGAAAVLLGTVAYSVSQPPAGAKAKAGQGKKKKQ